MLLQQLFVVALLQALLVSWGPTLATGYAMLRGPIRGRNSIYGNHCAHCANGPGPCGDGGGEWAKDNEPSKLNSKYQTPRYRLKGGQILDLHETTITPRLGHRVVELCPNPGETITEDCFTIRFLRDPTDSLHSPYDPNSPAIAPYAEDSCTLQDDPNVRWIVPNIPTHHGIVRWNWQYGQNCISDPIAQRSAFPDWRSPGGCSLPEKGGQPSCGDRCPAPGCQETRLINCVDVEIVAGEGDRGLEFRNHATNKIS